MKSRKLLNEFWAWFAENAPTISSEAQPQLLDVLDQRLRHLNPRLSWEIGPGRVEPWLLAISPNLDKEVVQDANAMIAAAPKVQGWEFYASRQPKQWDYQVEVEGPDGVVSLDASSWQFVLLRYPDGLKEVLLAAPELPNLTTDQRWQTAAIVLESILGEEALMAKVDEFELVQAMEPRLAAKQRPISELKQAVA